MAGCCAVIELVSRALLIGKIIITYVRQYDQGERSKSHPLWENAP